MVMMTAAMVPMNHPNTAKVKEELVSETYSHAIMGIVFPVFTYVMVTMIVWITVMKTIDTNVVCI